MLRHCKIIKVRKHYLGTTWGRIVSAVLCSSVWYHCSTMYKSSSFKLTTDLNGNRRMPRHKSIVLIYPSFIIVNPCLAKALPMSSQKGTILARHRRTTCGNRRITVNVTTSSNLDWLTHLIGFSPSKWLNVLIFLLFKKII